MVNTPYHDTAVRYCVDDLPSASLPGSRLQNILERLRLDGSLTALSLAFLQKHGLQALCDLASGALTYDGFRELALAEQSVRVEATKAAMQAREAARKAREDAMQLRMKQALERDEAARLAKERDPNYLAKIKNQELRARYGICTYVEQDCFHRLMDILKRTDAGERLSPEDIVWLSSVGAEYFTEKLRVAYHRLEAAFFSSEFEKSGDPWAAVNASSHYRKCKCPSDADAMLRTIKVEKQASLKLKSAICTTHGGAMRDLRRWNEALKLGEMAHAFKPQDYRPCTLLGAVHMEMGNYSLGQEWYAKAVERGATVDAVDQELRSIYFSANQTKREEMRQFLLDVDPIRFAWVTPKSKAHKERP